MILAIASSSAWERTMSILNGAYAGEYQAERRAAFNRNLGL